MSMPQQPPGYQGPPPGYQGPPPPGPHQGPPPPGPHQGPPPPGPHTGPPPPGPHTGPPPPGLGQTQQFHPAQYGPRPPAQQQRPPMANAIRAVWTLGLISVAATAVGLSVSEHGQNAWHSVHAWGGLAILGAVLTLTPAIGASGLTPHRAWQVAACGAATLVLFWVLFVLPSVGSNTSLVVTIGAAAGVVAAWIAPGRDVGGGQGPQEHTW